MMISVALAFLACLIVFLRFPMDPNVLGSDWTGVARQVELKDAIIVVLPRLLSHLIRNYEDGLNTDKHSWLVFKYQQTANKVSDEKQMKAWPKNSSSVMNKMI